MDYRVARQKKPATANECSVATSRGQRRFEVILLLPLTKLAKFNSMFWPQKEGIKVGKVKDLPFDNVFVKSFHQWPKEKYIGHYVKDLSQSLYHDEKCFQRNKIYVSYAGGHLPWRPMRRGGSHEIWIPGCHSNSNSNSNVIENTNINDHNNDSVDRSTKHHPGASIGDADGIDKHVSIHDHKNAKNLKHKNANDVITEES